MTRRMPIALAAMLLAAACAPAAAPPADGGTPPAGDAGAAAAPTPWERSRAEGYAFRGVGQEPGWTVEIAPGREIRAVLDYGERTVTVPAPEPLRQGLRTTYEAPAERLRLVIVEMHCADAMSGEPMTHRVSLTVGERELQGCGRSLEAGAPIIGADVEWRLEELEGRPALRDAGGEAPTLRLGSDGRAGGSTGCNTYGGGYTVEGAAIRFGTLVMTRRACVDPALNEQERRFAEALAAADRMQVAGDTLTLYAGTREVARFTAAWAG